MKSKILLERVCLNKISVEELLSQQIYVLIYFSKGLLLPFTFPQFNVVRSVFEQRLFLAVLKGVAVTDQLGLSDNFSRRSVMDWRLMPVERAFNVFNKSYLIVMLKSFAVYH